MEGFLQGALIGSTFAIFIGSIIGWMKVFMATIAAERAWYSWVYTAATIILVGGIVGWLIR